MFVVVGWFVAGEPDPARLQTARERLEQALAETVNPAYQRHVVGGPGWGVTMMHGTDMVGLAWPFHATDGHLTAISLGVPIGPDIAAGPLDLCRRLLDGEDLHREVVPPFGLVAVDGDRRVVVQQDWLGMCRIFTSTVDDLTVFATRPSLVAHFLHGSPAPDLSAWGSYLATGFFGGSMSPVEGVRLLHPGERLVAERHEDRWLVESQARIGVDAIVLAGRATANRPEDALDEAAQALIGTATRLSQLYSGPIELGLSGGKDSRLIAAASLAAGLRPNLVTNIDVPEEGETASELVATVHRTRGIDLNHRLRRVSDPATVLDVGLAERIDRFQRRYDYEYPSSFSVRPPPPLRMELEVDVQLSGVGGELVSGYWYPKGEQTAADTATRQLMKAIPRAALRSDVHAAEEARIRGILAAITEAGLDREHIIDYLYLVERVRRWYSSAYSFMTVTPFLAPGFVKASFAFDPQLKRERAVHARLLRRLLPEWADLPFVSDTRGSTATRVWQGDGIATIAEMRDTCKGQLPAMVEPDEVDMALRLAHEGKLADSQVLRQFAWAAQASKRLEPGTVGEPTGVTLGRITSPEPLVPLQPKPPVVPKPRNRSARVRQPLVALARKVAYTTPWGQRAWSAARALRAGRK